MKNISTRFIMFGIVDFIRCRTRWAFDEKHLTKIHNVWYCLFSFVVGLDGHLMKTSHQDS